MSWSPLNPDDPKSQMLVGDEPWDIASDALREIVRLYRRDLGRLPYIGELIRTIQDVLQSSWSDLVHEGETTELIQIRAKTKKIPRRQRYQIGDVLRATAANGQSIYARIFEPGGLMNPAVGVYDSLGMPSDDLDAITARPVIVKITPIHYQLMEKRAWIVIGHRPITDRDREHPYGPNELSGDNCQLIAANFYYGLPDKKFHNIDDYLVRNAKRR